MVDLYSVIGKRNALVMIAGLPGVDRDPWAALTGGGVTAPITRSYNGGSRKANIVPGRPVVADIVVTRPFSPMRDSILLMRLRPLVSRFRVASITKIYVDADGIAVGRKTVWLSCLLSSINGPDYDEASADSGHLTTTWTPSDVL